MSGLVEALIVTIRIDLSRVVPGNKDEVCRCQSEANRPPEGGDQQSSVIRGNGVSGEGILGSEC